MARHVTTEKEKSAIITDKKQRNELAAIDVNDTHLSDWKVEKEVILHEYNMKLFEARKYKNVIYFGVDTRIFFLFVIPRRFQWDLEYFGTTWYNFVSLMYETIHKHLFFQSYAIISIRSKSKKRHWSYFKEGFYEAS